MKTKFDEEKNKHVTFPVPFKVEGSFVKKDVMKEGTDVLDDLSLLKTIVPNEDMTDVMWDPSVLSAGSDADRQAFFQDVINECHDKAIQCLIGFGMYGSQPENMRNWLLGIADGKTTPLTIEAFAERIVAHMDAYLPLCDGISFDIENLVPKTYPETQLQKVRSGLSLFYQQVAQKLIGQAKLVGVATAGLVSDKHSHFLYTNLAPQDEDQPMQKPEVPPAWKQPAGADYRVHDFRLALGHENILIRPMAYDNFAPTINNEHHWIEYWHQDIVLYALEEIGLPPSQFQLGVKTIAGKNKYGGYITKPTVIHKKCRRLLRPRQVGLCYFPVSKGSWVGGDIALNKDFGAPVSYLLNQPLQAPHDYKTMSRAFSPLTL